MTVVTGLPAASPAIEAEEVTSARAWEGFMQIRPHASFLQSWVWGEFQQELGHRVIRLALVEHDQLTAAAQAIVMGRRLARFLYVPHGPVVDWTDDARLGALMSGLLAIARRERVHYVRIQPRAVDSDALQGLLRKQGWRPAPVSDQPDVDWLLDIDLSTSDEELLARMRPTTRYLVLKAPRLGVSVTHTDDPAAMHVFHTLLTQTARRGRFKPHPQSYLQKQFEVLSRHGMARLFVAWQSEGSAPKPLAAAITVSYGDNASYVHAASLATKIPGAYLVVWAAIQDARARALKLFDFWGIGPSGSHAHAWQGLTLFKKGFGGYEASYLTAWDLPLRFRYSAVYLLEAYYYRIIRRWSRRLVARIQKVRRSS